MKSQHAICLFLFCLLFIGCKPSDAPFNYMVLDEVIYVKEFPQIYSLNNESPVELPVIGVKNFVICDSLLIASVANSDGYWSIMSLLDYTLLGTYIRHGNGPNEFSWAPSLISDAHFYKKSDHLFSTLIDSSKGQLYEINIDSTIQTNQLQIRTIKDSLPQLLFNCVMIDNTTFFCRELSPNQTQQTRYILQGNERIVPRTFEKLNASTLREEEDCNILSTIIKYNRQKDILVEMPIGQNHLNIYSTDGTFGKTICVGKEVDNIEEIQDTQRWNRKYTYADVRLYERFWGVLRINEKIHAFQTLRTKYPEIQLFDWEGSPLALIRLNRHITAFDIDFVNGFLYTIDHQTDEMYRYDVGSIVKELDLISSI